MILVSSCLAGLEVRYDGNHSLHSKVRRLVEHKKAVTVCPELLGGFGTPREPAEIIGESGEDVLDGNARVVDKTGKDVTASYIEGAEKALEIAKRVGATTIILKENSPSCGSSMIYNGEFNGKKVVGDGVTSALLKRNGFTVISEKQFVEGNGSPSVES
ncbi:DUF523 domain-containing protein [Alkalihalobacillus sp. CinArs1]|uniref:DUF523 domain-containing protein n=1 Tax=Alkalihalobacillus sp. CinArs1 TaxID=2995314 RepID=UPI0022DE029D|nr:DUF523 domain-containing protein [Alkalihalobacillus sp. CinArs1]